MQIGYYLHILNESSSIIGRTIEEKIGSRDASCSSEWDMKGKGHDSRCSPQSYTILSSDVSNIISIDKIANRLCSPCECIRCIEYHINSTED